MKRILISLLIMAATLNAMATDFAVATLTLKGNTSLEQGKVTLVKTDDPAAASYCAPLYIDMYHVVMYALNGSDKYQIWANADLTNLPLGFKTYSDANYTITVSNVSGSETLSLFDAVEDQMVSLTNGQTYVFTAAANTTIADRFFINYVPSAPKICHRYGALQVYGSKDMTVKVLNMDGTATSIADTNITTNSEVEIPLAGLAAGQYKVEWNSKTLIIDVK